MIAYFLAFGLVLATALYVLSKLPAIRSGLRPVPIRTRNEAAPPPVPGFHR